jgi:3-phosphoshikimate 1-carboxyvinyltransferase
VNVRIRRAGALRGQAEAPGDKSIAHRTALLGAVADGTSRVAGFLPAGDPLATIDAVRQLGILVKVSPRPEAPGRPPALSLEVYGRGLHGLRAARDAIDCRNAGTAIRLLAGLLAGQRFSSTLDGSEQLRRRPMSRVVEPLARMGAGIESSGGHAPLVITGGLLHGIDYTLPVASAQVKSAILLAALYAEGPTIIREPAPTRDYTERMLRAMGADVHTSAQAITVRPAGEDERWHDLAPLDLALPGDLSSAAFPIVAGLLLPGSCVRIENVGVNPTRTGLLDVLTEMGASVALENERRAGGERVADVGIEGRYEALRGVAVGGDTVVRMIDEFPILAVAATQAHGTTTVRDAAELRVKEVDRIARVAEELRKLGAQIEEQPDGFSVEGPVPLRGTIVDSHGDHRLAMALAVAGLVAEGETTIIGAETASDSFPGFWETMARLGAEIG